MSTPPILSPTVAGLTGSYVHLCGGVGLPPLDRDDPCCMTAAMSEGERCSCWQPVYTPEPTLDLQAAPNGIRRTLCHDCAYRPGSPERSEVNGDQLPGNLKHPFVCHQGMPTLRGYTRPELDALGLDGGWCLWGGAVGDRDDFGPIQHGGTTWLADGQPAGLCAGWAAVAGARRT